METEKVIEFLRVELDTSYAYIQRGMFVEINTSIISETGFPITVFVTNNLPDFIVVSDNAWIYESKYGNWLAMSNNDRKNLETKWGITVRTDETDQYYHSVICRK